MAKLEENLSEYAEGDFFCMTPITSAVQGMRLASKNIRITHTETYLVYSFKRQSDGRAVIYIDDKGYQYMLGNGTVTPLSTQMRLGAYGESTSDGVLTVSQQPTYETGIYALYYIPDYTKKTTTGERVAMPPWGELTIPYGEEKNTSSFYKYADYAKTTSAFFSASLGKIDNTTIDLTTSPDDTTFILPHAEMADVASIETTLYDESTISTQSSSNVTIDNYLKRFTAYFSAYHDTLLGVTNTPKYTAYNSISQGTTPHSMRQDYCGATFFNIIMTHNLTQAIRFIEDGTLPDDATVNSHKANSGDNDNAKGEDGNKESSFYDGTPTAPSFTSAMLSNLHHYWMTAKQMESFFEEVWNTDLSDYVTGAFTGIYSNLISNVVSLKYMPTTASNLGGTGDAGNVILGFKTYDNLSVQTVGASVAPIVDIGSYTFTRAFNSFADYAPYTEIALSLPFVGIVPIDTNLFMGVGGGKSATLNIKAHYDLTSGLITYFLLRGTTPISYVSGMMAVEIPISLQSGIDTWTSVASNAITKTASIGTDIATRSPIGIMADIASGSKADVGGQRIFSATGGDGAFYVHPKCALMIRHPQYNRPSSYAHTIGFPSYVSKKISALSGYNVVENPKIPLADGMTVEERDLIVSAMQDGLHY